MTLLIVFPRSNADKWHFWGGMFVKHSCTRSVERNRETGYRGNAVSSSVKNSVGERHRIERWREVKRGEGRSGSRSRVKDRSRIEWRLDGDGGDILKTDECCDVLFVTAYRLSSIEKLGCGSSGRQPQTISHALCDLWSVSDFTEYPFGDLQGYHFLELLLLCLPHHI